MPSGKPTRTARQLPNSTRDSVAKACASMLPSANTEKSVRATVMRLGTSAGGKRPLRAIAS